MLRPLFYKIRHLYFPAAFDIIRYRLYKKDQAVSDS